MFGMYDDVGKMELKAKIKQSERRIKAKEQQLEDVQNELDLLKQQEFDTCKNNILYFGFQNPGITEKAMKWLKMLEEGKDKDGNKINKRTKCEEKLNYKILTESIREILGDDSIVIEEIIIYGQYAEAYQYKFTHNNIKYYIQIPVVNIVPFKSYDYYGVEHAFGITLHVYTSPHVTECIGASIYMDEIKDIWKKHLENPEVDFDEG